MQKTLLFLAALTTASNLMADEWVQPTYEGTFQPLTADDTVYIYNTEAKLFLTEGNDWGTHATVGPEGLKFVVSQYVTEGSEWDGQTYIIEDYSVKKGGWYKMFITDGGNIYMDNGSQEDNRWQFVDLGNNTYQIVGAASNPVWSSTGEMAGYIMGRYTDYVNARDGIESGTGVVYDYFGPDHSYAAGTFQTTWTFVSQADYAAYSEQVATYEAALQLDRKLAEAEAMGVSGLDDEKAVYANTQSTLSDIEQAMTSTEEKTLAYYEVSVTPTNPVNILTDDCSTADAWVNGANASSLKTGTWAADNWEGFANGDTYISIWDANLQGSIYRERSGLPNGIYVVTIAAQAQDMAGAVFANANQKAVPADNCGHIYKITTEVTDGNLQFGYLQETAGTNWATLDNISVDYYGQGTEAYRYWLSSLLESAPTFDDVTVMDSLISEYEEVLLSVKTPTSKDDILAIIPAYEDILNKINLNIQAYATLIATCNAADDMATTEGINELYGNLLSDYVQEQADPVIEEPTLDTDDIYNVATALQTIIDEAQNYIWDREKLTKEAVIADSLYTQYKDSCSLEAAEAYLAWAQDYANYDYAQTTLAQVDSLLKQLYTIEFNLTVPVDPASEENPIDYTTKIQYPSFDGGRTGWTNDGWSTCGTNDWNSFADGEVIDQLYLNLWNQGNARVYQTLTGLPAGKYTMQISAFADAEGMQVYAGQDYMDVVAGQNEQGAGSIISQTDTLPLGSSIWYGNVYKINTIVGEDGTLEIGARITNGATVWGMIDRVKLLYKGKAEANITVNDITALIDDYLNNRQGSDIDGDGQLTVNDISALIQRYLAQ